MCGAGEALPCVNALIITTHAQAGELLGAACVEVVESCVALVKQLKGITATYRMTSKGPPTRHSHYVTGGPYVYVCSTACAVQIILLFNQTQDIDVIKWLALC